MIYWILQILHSFKLIYTIHRMFPFLFSLYGVLALHVRKKNCPVRWYNLNTEYMHIIKPVFSFKYFFFSQNIIYLYKNIQNYNFSAQNNIYAEKKKIVYMYFLMLHILICRSIVLYIILFYF